MRSFDLQMPETSSILERSYKGLPRKVKAEGLQRPGKVLTVFTFNEL